MINGLINVYKEAGYTSHDVVARLRGIVRQKKIGHTGTLDPDAVGVLPVCLGNATKLCDMLTDRSKEYEVCMRLGVTTDTLDMSGRVLTEKPVFVSVEAAVEAVGSFVGGYEQIPPMYSAIKVNGKKLYELARKGEEIERKPRHVDIPYINIIKIDIPELTFVVGCSKGTYIRSLCADIGERLGCGGAMSFLKRTRVGNFTIDSSLTLSRIEQLYAEGRLDEYVIAPDSVFEQYGSIQVKESFEGVLLNGNKLFVEQLAAQNQRCPSDGERVRTYASDGRFKAVYEYSEREGCFKPYKMFL